MIQILINWALARATEKTTWIGFVGSLVSYFSLTLSQNLQEAITTALLAIVSAIAIFYKERKKV